MKDKGSREASFFLLKIPHRNAYRQANIFKVFGFSEGGESKKANCTTFLRIASVLYTGRHALRPVMCMERFYPKEWHESQQQQICCQNSVLLYMFYPFHLSGKYRFLCGSVQYLSLIHISYGLGGHYRLSKYWELTSNFALTWRAPHVHELYSSCTCGALHVSAKLDVSSQYFESR